MSRVLVMGASGRVGTYLRQFWPGMAVDALWQYRADAPAQALLWAPLDGTVPDCRPVATVLCLSGVTRGPALAQNTDLARAALRAADRLGAGRVLLASSSAVYGATSGPHAEDAPCHPATAYGAAKLAMEQVALTEPGAPRVTCLRIGNIAGADALLGGLDPDHAPRLDRFNDGRAPRRAYIGPMTLARVLADLVYHPTALPPVLNMAQPGLIGMDALLRAAGVAWTWQPASGRALPELGLVLDRARALVHLPRSTPDALVAEWRLTWAASRWSDPA